MFKIILFVLLVIFAGSPASGSETMAQMYPGGWHTDFHVGISRALAKNNIRGCGEFKYKPSADNVSWDTSVGEFLVRCTADGKRWVAYLVWAGIDDVMGPYAPDRTMN